jgi:hypothetical protein
VTLVRDLRAWHLRPHALSMVASSTWTAGRAASSEQSSDVANVARAGKQETYFALGKGWTAAVGDDPTLQYQLTNDAENLMKMAFAGPRAAADVPGEKDAATALAKALGGRVVHVTL